MAAFNKVQDFAEQLFKGKHDFSSHTFKVMLSNTAPNAATSAVKGDITEITAQNGYSAGGAATTMSLSESGGTAKATATDVTFTASGGSFGPFRYAVVYNDTQSSPSKPLVGWYDYGSAITLNDGESFTVDFDGTNGFYQGG